ncbi:MAG: VWA domain-containing protein [Lapillicoccus sp.]
MPTAPDALLLGFARALRAAGVAVTPDREAGYLAAVAAVGLDDERATYWAGRATLTGSPDDIERYDKLFRAWFTARQEQLQSTTKPPPPTIIQSDLSEDADTDGDGSETEAVRATASGLEVLRQRDVGLMSATEKAWLATMFASLRRPSPHRRATRQTPWHRGTVDPRRTLRRQLEHLGEPAELAWRHRGTRRRRVVLLIDVSGSMSAYADALLRLGHHWVVGGGPVEVFTMGTRLTHVTRALHQRDPERALAAAGEVVPDWSGGTRLGESLKAFLDRWGQRGMARGAVVVVYSDGWERGGVELLDEQMRRLRSLSHRVVWVNPHRGKDGYLPVQQGIVAALPHCDAFVAGHSIRTFDDLAEVVTRG